MLEFRSRNFVFSFFCAQKYAPTLQNIPMAKKTPLTSRLSRQRLSLISSGMDARQLEITVRNDFTAGPRDQRGQDADAHGGVEEVHRAIGEHRVGAGGVEAVDRAVV